MEENNKPKAPVRSLTQEQIDWLRNCPHVQSFSGKKIFWTKKVLDQFCEGYDKGESATEILKKLKIDISILGASRVAAFRNYYSETWRPRHYNLPPAATHGVYRKDSPGVKIKTEPNKAEAKFSHRLTYLEQEVEFLKKNFHSEPQKGYRATKPAEKYQIIYDMTHRDGNQLHISWLFDVAGVSKSGYYEWLQDDKKRAAKEAQDRKDFELILSAYKHRGYAKGARGIYMRLLHQGKAMNLKKIRRLMKKYGLFCPIRKANPYRAMLRAGHESKIAPNLVNRQFKDYGPRKVLLTDITYLFYGHGERCYLSVVKDAYTNEVLSYATSQNLQEDFVLETLEKLTEKHGNELTGEVMLHSDQGSHYTSIQFSRSLSDHKLTQSMSRRANCWDNAPQESFFGHMKDEIKEKIDRCETYADVTREISTWMKYYNDDRYQWGLAKLSPPQYYKYCTTGVYPLNTLSRLCA